MSIRARSRAPVATAAVVLGGVALLAWRVRLTGADDPARSLGLAVALAGVLVASLVVPSVDRRRGLRTVVAVTLAGIAAFALVGAIVGPRPPAPWAATAIPLGLLAAVAEEALFRRVLYGRLLRYGPVPAVVVTAVAFALLHVPAYGWVAFPVDLGAGLVFGWQRHAAGTWAAPAVTHAAANLAAMLR